MYDHRKKQISLDALSFKNRNTVFITVMAPMQKNENDGKVKDGRNPATIMRVTDLQTGEICLLLCPALLITTLESYGDDYVGKSYEIHVSTDKVKGKDYKAVSVWEIDSDHDYSKMETVDKPDEKAGK